MAKAASRGSSHLGSVWTTLPMLLGFSAFALASVISIIASFYGIKLPHLVRDPAAIFDYPSYVGLFSHIGIFCMVSSAAVTGFTAWVTYQQSCDGTFVLAAASILSAVLTLDDTFMLHEQTSRLGEVVLVSIYGILVLLLWNRLRTVANGYDLRGFWVALGFLGLSVLTDLLKIYGPFAHWLEDFSKLSGFVAWLTFWTGFAGHALRKA